MTASKLLDRVTLVLVEEMGEQRDVAWTTRELSVDEAETVDMRVKQVLTEALADANRLMPVQGVNLKGRRASATRRRA